MLCNRNVAWQSLYGSLLFGLYNTTEAGLLQDLDDPCLDVVLHTLL